MKKRSIIIILVVVLSLFGTSSFIVASQVDSNSQNFVSDNSNIEYGSNVSVNSNLRNLSDKNVVLTVNGKDYIMHLYDNPTAEDFYSKLPLTITANDYMGYEEKVCRLNDVTLSTENAPKGDNPLIAEIGYYQPGNWIAIYYGFIGYWDGKIPLGSIDASPDELKQIQDSSTVTFRAK